MVESSQPFCKKISIIDVRQVTNYKSAFYIRKNWENLAEEMPVTNSGKIRKTYGIA